MINHIRTLLLNLPRDTWSMTPDQYEEYIDPDYSPVAAKFVITDVVMPTGLSRHEKLIRAFSILNLLHRPDYDKYLHMFDPRISYSLDDRRVINALADGDERHRLDSAVFYSYLHSVIYSGTNMSLLFDCLDFHPDSFAELKKLWMGGETAADRSAAAVLALTYWMERARNMVKKVRTPVITHTPKRPVPSSSSACCVTDAPNTDYEWLLNTDVWDAKLDACASCSGSVLSFEYQGSSAYKCAADPLQYGFYWEDAVGGCTWQSPVTGAGLPVMITVYDALLHPCRTVIRSAPNPTVYPETCGEPLLDETGAYLLDEDGGVLLQE
jgi:hypothetical protein